MSQVLDPQALPQTKESQRTVGRVSIRQKRFAFLGRHTLLIVVSAILLLPFYWMITAALKSDSQIFALPLQWWPNPVHWGNFVAVLNYPNFPYLQLLGNSIFYAGSVAIATMLSCAFVGYGFACLRFPGKELLFTITIATLMIPPIVTFIPTYVLFKYFGMIGTYLPLIAPNFFGNAFFIFMMRQFFLGLSPELTEAAKIDGASEFRIFWQIVLPLVRPALVVVMVFTILYTWQDFFGPLIYLSDPAQYPLSLGLFAFKAQRTTEWALLMAASAMVTLPLILLFTFTQRYFVQGIALTGIKG